MPSDIQRAQNLITEAIVTMFGRIGLSLPSIVTMASVAHFQLSECHLAPYPSKVFI